VSKGPKDLYKKFKTAVDLMKVVQPINIVLETANFAKCNSKQLFRNSGSSIFASIYKLFIRDTYSLHPKIFFFDLSPIWHYNLAQH
jgi:hypothetical protein